MSVAGLDTLIRRLRAEPAWEARLLADPEEALAGADLDPAERWAVLEAAGEAGGDAAAFASLLRTRLAVVGVRLPPHPGPADPSR